MPEIYSRKGMVSTKPLLLCCFLTFLLAGTSLHVYAQNDTTAKRQDTVIKRQGIDSFILKRKGLLGKLARNLLTDTNKVVTATPVRNDLLFSIYEGRVIRSVKVQVLDFGTAITDTTKVFRNRLTKLANSFHRKSRDYVVGKNLFFHEGDKVFSYLLADNERHLRDQPYLQDARIVIQPADNSYDSVDITVLVKDVLSIGGSFHMHNTTSVDVSIREDNLGGWGDRLQGSILYDNQRREKVGYGGEFIKRNIAGSFIDAYAGFDNFNDNFNNGRDEETTVYTRFLKPLVHPYMRFTYALDLAYHETDNMYLSDSLYRMDFRYQFYNIDAWLGWNTGAYKLTKHNVDDRTRTILSMRVLRRKFRQVPEIFSKVYDARYADLDAVLGGLSIFRQTFYKTRYIYGFGRNEDVPEGMDLSLTAGWTKRHDRERPYVGLDFSKNFFTAREAYFNYTARAGGYWNKSTLEDVDLLFNLDFFSRLRNLGPRWKQRTFISAGLTAQFNSELNEPLLLESQFGLPELRNDRKIGGDLRATVKSESVFFSPLNIANFRFAPFVFANAALITPPSEKFSKSDIYTSIGGGIRTRNESLIFGTIEVKAHYFPRPNYFGDRTRIEFNSNIRFKYNRQIIKRPELVATN